MIRNRLTKEFGPCVDCGRSTPWVLEAGDGTWLCSSYVCLGCLMELSHYIQTEVVDEIERADFGRLRKNHGEHP